MDKPDIRLIGVDLDDTLLDDRKNLPERVMAAVGRALAAGVQVVPATGRNLSGIPPALLALPGLRYAITSNGALLYDVGEQRVLREDCLSLAASRSLLALSRGFAAYIAVYIDGKGYTDTADLSAFTGVLDDTMVRYLRDSRILVPNLAALLEAGAGRVEKFSVHFADLGERERARAAYAARGDVAIVSSIPTNLELNAPGANKGSALLALAKMLGIPREQVMAIGDSGNDIDMLKMAGLGVAMKNAKPEVLAAADAVTALDNNQGGAALVIEEILAGQSPAHAPEKETL